jgi:hypothetical protein
MQQEKIQQFITLAKKMEDLKRQLKEVQEPLQTVMAEIGLGSHFQDPTTGTVFEIVKPNGTFVSFKEFDYERTKLEGESKGSLSIKRAQELGYKI